MLAKLMLQFDLTMSFDVQKTFSGKEEIASTCNSLQEQLMSKTKHASVFSGVANISKFQGGQGCGRVSVEGQALLRALVGIDLKNMLTLSNATAAENGGAAMATATAAQGSPDTLVNAADVIASSTISLHSDTRFEVDIVAQPEIPFVETDIRLHLLAQVGEAEAGVAPSLQIKDLVDRSKLTRYFRHLPWRDLAGELDATFTAQFDASLNFLGVEQEFKLEPVLSLSSDDLLAPGFGLTPLIDIRLASSTPKAGATDDLATLFEKITEKVLNELDSLIDGVRGLSVPDLPSLFEPVKETGLLKLSEVATTFKELWKVFAEYRRGTSSFINLAERYSLKSKVVAALERLIHLITGISVKANPQLFLALAHDVFGMLHHDGRIPTTTESRSINPFADKPKANKPLSKLSQYHLGSLPKLETTAEDKVLRLLNKVLPRQLTLRGLFSFCMRYIKTSLARLAHRGEVAAVDAWQKYHQHLDHQATLKHYVGDDNAALASSVDLVIAADRNGLLTVDVSLSLQTVADVVGLLGSISATMSGFLTSAIAEDGMSSKLLGIGDASGLGNSLVVSAAKIAAGVQVAVRIAINTTKLLKLQPDALSLVVTSINASAGASLRADELRLSFGDLGFGAELEAAINVRGVLNRSGDVSQPVLAQLKTLWADMEWTGNYMAEANVSLTSLPGDLARFFTESSPTASIEVSNGDLFKHSRRRQRRFDYSDFLVIVKNIEFPTCEEQERIASQFLESIGLFTSTITKAGNAALTSVKNETVSVLNQNLNVGDSLGDVTINKPDTAVDGNVVNLKNTFDDLRSGLGMDVQFCIVPNLNENILQIKLYLSVSAEVVLATPDVTSLSLGTQKALEFQGITAEGTFKGDAMFFVNASMVIHVGEPNGNRRARRTNASAVPPNSTMLSISSGFRVNAQCDLLVLRNGESFLNGTASLDSAGFDVLFPFGGHGPLADIHDSLASTTISPPRGAFSAALEFDANKAFQIDALRELGLTAPKFLLSLDDANVFSNALLSDKMQVNVDFDVTDFKQYIITAMAKIAGMEFGFDIAGLTPNVPVALRGLLQDLTDKMKIVHTATVQYFEECADGSDEAHQACGKFSFPTVRGLFEAIKAAVAGSIETDASVTFGNEMFSITIEGGFSIETRKLSVNFHIEANFVREGGVLQKFFGTVDSLLSRVSEGLPPSEQSNPANEAYPSTSVFQGVKLYLEVRCVILSRHTEHALSSQIFEYTLALQRCLCNGCCIA